MTKTATKAQILKTTIALVSKGEDGPGLGIRALSLSEQTAANVPMHIETDPSDYMAEYRQPFTSTNKLKKKNKKNRKALSPLANVTEIVS